MLCKSTKEAYRSMYKYQIEIHHKTEHKWDWITVYTPIESDLLALESANTALYNYTHPVVSSYDTYQKKKRDKKLKDKYDGYCTSHIFKNDGYCDPPQSYDIINHIFMHDGGFREMGYFNVNWKDYKDELSDLAAFEEWSNTTYPNKGILVNYMAHTYKKLKKDNNIIISDEYGLFNTGLFTKYYDPIYAYQKSNTDVIEFLTAYELGNKNITSLPERANYFDKPELLIFDWHYPINVQYGHILDELQNKNRLPEEIQNNSNLPMLINGAIDIMKKKVSSNYKIAVPQYFDGQIQLLLPLCLINNEKPDLALTVTKIDGCYQGHTCITIDMAYNNARLIAKPESTWLTL